MSRTTKEESCTGVQGKGCLGALNGEQTIVELAQTLPVHSESDY